MKFEATLGDNNTKLGLPQDIPTLEELEYMEYNKDNYQEFGMLIDCMEVHNEDF